MTWRSGSYTAYASGSEDSGPPYPIRRDTSVKKSLFIRILPSLDDSALKGWQDCSMKRRGIAEVLAEAQGRLHRLTPAEAAAAMREGATLVDTRDGDLRSLDGGIPGSVHIPLSVLEWRVDPTSGHQSPAIAGHEDRLILICNEGYSSSLAAVRLHDLGFVGTTDVIGGFVAWAAAGLPVER